MRNNITGSANGATNLAASAMVLVLLLHGIAFFLSPGWLWGANTLEPLLAPSALAALIVAAALVLPPVAGRVAKPLEAVGGNRAASFLSDKVVATVLGGGLAAGAFWMLGDKAAGATAWLLHATPPLGMTGPVGIMAAEMADLFDAESERVLRGIAVFFGAATICLLVLCPLRSTEKGRGAAAGLLVAISGSALVFLTPRADLAFEIPMTFLFLALGAASLEGRISSIAAGAAAACAAVAHPIGLALLPAFAFLVFISSPSSAFRRGAVALLLSTAAVAALLALLSVSESSGIGPYISEAKALWTTGSGTRAAWVASGVGEGGSISPALQAAGWVIERVWGTFNGLLYTAPAGLALAVAGVLGGRGRKRAPALSFLRFAALTACAAAFLAAPYAGAARSWGIYAPAGVCATIYGIWWLIETVEDNRAYRAAALGAAVLSLVHLGTALLTFADASMGADSLKIKAISSSPWDVRGRADTLERLSVFYLAGGDTLTASEMLSHAYDARPNPLYLGTAGSYYAHAKRYDLAEREFERLVQAMPLDVEANLSLGVLHAIRGDMAGARDYFLVAYGDTTLTLPEPDVDSRADWESMEKGPEREKLIKSRIEKRQSSSRVFTQGDEAARQGLLGGAVRQYQAALRIYPRWGKMQYEVHNHIGTIYAMQGRFKEAAYEMLLAVNHYDRYQLCYYIVNAVGYGPARPGAVVPHTRPEGE